MKKYWVHVSPQTSQPFSRASAIGSIDSLHETWTTYSGAPATRASWIARFVASPSVSVERVAVLRVHHHERTGVGGDFHRLEERLVVDHQRTLVRHEQLVGRDALIG